MKPVDQEFIHNPDIGQYGDCQRATLASLLELPISEVPHFLRDANGIADDFWCSIQKFCNSKGYAYMELPMGVRPNFWGDGPDIYHEISGPSPRGGNIFHSVVGKNGEIVFDPHPSRSGLDGDPSKWTFSYLVKL